MLEEGEAADPGLAELPVEACFLIGDSSSVQGSGYVLHDSVAFTSGSDVPAHTSLGRRDSLALAGHSSRRRSLRTKTQQG